MGARSLMTRMAKARCGTGSRVCYIGSMSVGDRLRSPARPHRLVTGMLLKKLFENLALTVDPFATCKLADGASPWLSALDDPRLARVIETILNRPEQHHTLDVLASIAYTSRSTFTRHFEQSFGRTPMDYLREIRLRRAAQLLRIKGLTVDSVASKVGFAGRSHFSRAFHDQFGCSPADFRRHQH
jgi:transcriptional regulator GlxA family with amidase domain